MFTLGITHFLVLDKCLMPCVYHYVVIQSIFTVQNCCVLSVYPSRLCLQLLTTTDLSAIFILLLSTAYHLVESVQYIEFLYWLLLLSNMQLTFPHVFYGLITLIFFLLLSNIPLSGCTTLFIHFC